MAGDRDKIVRKIAALLARAADEASSAAEVSHAMHIAHKLMAQYNLTLDEVMLKREPVGQGHFHVRPEDSDYANILVTAIARLAHCHAQGVLGPVHEFIFTGLRVDVLYAEWLFRASAAAMARGWTAFEGSARFAELRRSHPLAELERHFKLGFSIDLAERIKKLAAEDGTPNALIVLKEQRIADAMGAAAAAKRPGKDLVRVKGKLIEAFKTGAEASRSVPLRQQVEDGDKEALP